MLWFGSAPSSGGKADIAGSTHPPVDILAQARVPLPSSTVGTHGKLPSHHELIEQLRRNLAAYYEDIPLCIQQCTETIKAAQQADDATILAIARMQRALDMMVVEGIKTTIPLHKKIMADERFQRGDFSTKFMEEFES